jgi:hypothetical protein
MGTSDFLSLRFNAFSVNGASAVGEAGKKKPAGNSGLTPRRYMEETRDNFTSVRVEPHKQRPKR